MLTVFSIVSYTVLLLPWRMKSLKVHRPSPQVLGGSVVGGSVVGGSDLATTRENVLGDETADVKWGDAA